MYTAFWCEIIWEGRVYWNHEWYYKILDVGVLKQTSSEREEYIKVNWQDIELWQWSISLRYVLTKMSQYCLCIKWLTHFCEEILCFSFVQVGISGRRPSTGMGDQCHNDVWRNGRMDNKEGWCDLWRIPWWHVPAYVLTCNLILVKYCE